jgi:predicted small secreted protein
MLDKIKGRITCMKNLRTILTLVMILMLHGCPIVRGAGNAVEATGEGIGHAVEGTGKAIGQTGRELAQ